MITVKWLKTLTTALRLQTTLSELQKLLWVCHLSGYISRLILIHTDKIRKMYDIRITWQNLAILTYHAIEWSKWQNDIQP